MLHIRSDMHRLDERILLISEFEHQVLSESGIPDRLKAARKVERGKALAVEESHILYALKRFRKHCAVNKGAGERPVCDRFRSVFNLVFTAPRARILDQRLTVFGIQDTINSLIVIIVPAD